MLAEHMTWLEYRDFMKRGGIVFLPIGSLEQHGPHLPLNVDAVIPSSFAKRVAEKVNGMVLPVIPYGARSQPTSGGGPLFPGTTSLDGMTLMNMVINILQETYRHGGRKFVIINGHYENQAFVTEAIELFMKEAKDVKFLILSWWDLITNPLRDEIFAEAGFPGWDTEHAAITETALMMYFTPELVRNDKVVNDMAERKPPYAVFPAPRDIIPESGVLYKAKYATREKGEKIAAWVTDAMVEIVRQEFGL